MIIVTMPKNKGKGGKKKRRGANTSSRIRKLEYAGDDEDYAKVIKLLGDRRCSVMCMKHPEREDVIGHIRGKMKKREWVRIGDWVLISFRDSIEKCRTVDITKKYNEYEVSQLKSDGLIKEFSKDKIEEEYVIGDDDEEETQKTYTNDPYGEPDRTDTRVHAVFTDDDDSGEESEEEQPKKQTKKPAKKLTKDQYQELEDVGDFNIDDI